MRKYQRPPNVSTAQIVVHVFDDGAGLSPKLDNFTFEKFTSGAAIIRTFNNASQLESHLEGGVTRTYGYDRNGNRTGKTIGTNTITYEWDLENRLREINDPTSGSEFSQSISYVADTWQRADDDPNGSHY